MSKKSIKKLKEEAEKLVIKLRNVLDDLSDRGESDFAKEINEYLEGYGT